MSSQAILKVKYIKSEKGKPNLVDILLSQVIARNAERGVQILIRIMHMWD